MLVDSHCHLDAAYFPEGPAEVLSRARAAGVAHVVVIGVGEDLEPARAAVALAAERGDVSATVGWHPHDAAVLDPGIERELETLVWAPGVVAVGEVGLDYHYMRSPADRQREVFRRMIALARKRGLPLVIHTRSAAADTLAILAEEGAAEVGGIIHCMSEDRAFAARALDLDFDLSFAGMVTFRNARPLQEVARWAPADRLLIETDSPYLAPLPLRGKRNEPANVVHTARFVAELRGVPFEELAASSSANAARRLKLAIAAT
jgi:TatD DNase family protein